MNAKQTKRAAFVFAAIVIFAAAVGIAYRRQIHSEEERRNWSRYYLSNETRSVLNGSESFELVSVDPTLESLKGDIAAGLNRRVELSITNSAAEKQATQIFHDHRVLGRTEVKDPKKRTELLVALYQSVEKYRGFGASCFDPRHGIVALAGTNRVELLICFECEQGAEFTAAGQKWFLIGKEPRELFNRTLQVAGVPLAKR